MRADVTERMRESLEMLRERGVSFRLVGPIHDGIGEIEHVRAALAIAAGLLSTTPQYEGRHPEDVYRLLLDTAAVVSK